MTWRGRKTYKIRRWNDSSSDPNLPETRFEVDKYAKSEPWSEAEVVSSELATPVGRDIERTGWGTHLPVLDLDIPHLYVPSTTPGHGHLYLEPPEPLTWPQYERLLDVLADCGILEPGYVGASKQRKATFLRLPWVKKEALVG